MDYLSRLSIVMCMPAGAVDHVSSQTFVSGVVDNLNDYSVAPINRKLQSTMTTRNMS